MLFREKICTAQMPSQNKSMLEVSSKSDDGKVLNIGVKMVDIQTDVETTRYSLKTPSLRLLTFFSKRNLYTGYEIRLVDTMDISPQTQSEHHRVAGNHLTRRHVCCDVYRNPASRAS